MEPFDVALLKLTMLLAQEAMLVQPFQSDIARTGEDTLTTQSIP